MTTNRKAKITMFPSGDIVVEDAIDGERIAHISYDPGDSLLTNFTYALRIATHYEFKGDDQ